MRTHGPAARPEHKKASLKIRDFGLDVKAVNEDGSFTGYGSVFGVEDSYGEIVAPGAFTESLTEIAAKGRPVPVLWQHRSDQPIGIYSSLKEDATGLYVEGMLLKDAVRQASESYALMKAGAVSGLSIGYYVRQSSYDEKTNVRTLIKLDLVEISLVTFPANDEARVEAVKSKIAHGELPSLNEFERFLREAGFSKTKAAVIANRGLAHLLRSESAGDPANEPEATKALSAVLSGFTLPTF
ncbi:HK97 family phage prohead protease [Methylorubrum extorquens]